MAIDFHAHLVDPQVYAETKTWSIFAQSQDPARAASVIARMADLDERIAAMDGMGVAIQVLSSSLVHQCTYEAEPADALRLDRQMNDRIAEAVASKPDRFRGLGSVPLQSPDLATNELTRCMRDLALSGVTISTRVRGLEIGDLALRPFWARAEELGAVVFLHPAGNHDPRFRKYQLWNSIGQSFEEAMAIASLFYEGILDAYPKLKIVVSHGGGYMPFYLGRLARNYIEKPATRVNMRKAPIDYVRMLYYDTCVYDPDTLSHLVEVVGSERIVMGSDYPVGDTKPVEFVRDCRRLDEAGKEMVLTGNAERLLTVTPASS
jgi:aminocarboxymuconate-semialdehyde decarboxylase